MSSFSVVAIVERGKAETALHHQLRGDGGSTTDMRHGEQHANIALQSITCEHGCANHAVPCCSMLFESVCPYLFYGLKIGL